MPKLRKTVDLKTAAFFLNTYLNRKFRTVRTRSKRQLVEYGEFMKTPARIPSSSLKSISSRFEIGINKLRSEGVGIDGRTVVVICNDVQSPRYGLLAWKLLGTPRRRFS